MKSTIKIITILGVVISFFSAYPMEKFVYHILKVNDLESINPFSQMNSLVVLNNNCDKIHDNDQFFTQ